MIPLASCLDNSELYINCREMIVGSVSRSADPKSTANFIATPQFGSSPSPRNTDLDQNFDSLKLEIFGDHLYTSQCAKSIGARLHTEVRKVRGHATRGTT